MVIDRAIQIHGVAGLSQAKCLGQNWHTRVPFVSLMARMKYIKNALAQRLIR
ncbi:hypothetical protein RUESEDTHA_03850 [Ruegeria sp. THAF57]|nr:hypothetical protein RUESEDTHA_03850 [Ruegeria sp. THAF57]